MIPWWVILSIILIAGSASLIFGFILLGLILGGDDTESFT